MYTVQHASECSIIIQSIVYSSNCMHVVCKIKLFAPNISSFDNSTFMKTKQLLKVKQDSLLYLVSLFSKKRRGSVP